MKHSENTSLSLTEDIKSWKDEHRGDTDERRPIGLPVTIICKSLPNGEQMVKATVSELKYEDIKPKLNVYSQTKVKNQTINFKN